MSTDITLTASIRSNLLSLQNASTLLDITSERLSTGKKVNSALDNPSSFFTARGLTNRASDLSARKDGLGQAISLLQATDKSINNITKLIAQAKATAQSAQEASTNGVSAVSSAKASFVGPLEINVVSGISTEAAGAATTTDAAKLSFAGLNVAGTAYATGTTINAYTGIGNAVNVIFKVTGYGGTDIAMGVVNGSHTIANLQTNINAMAGAGLTATWNTTTYDLDITSSIGGVKVQLTAESAGDVVHWNAYTTDGTTAANTTAVTNAQTLTYNLAGNGTDSVAAAFGMSDAKDVSNNDTHIFVNDVQRTITDADRLTVDAYVALLNAADADLAASYDLSSRKITFTGDNGTKLKFSDVATISNLGLTQGTGTTAVANLSDYSIDDGTAVAVTDLLTDVYVGSAVADTITFGVTGGSVGTAFAIQSTSTIADLVAAMNASDSAITAKFNTVTSKIDITMSDGGSLTATGAGTATFAALGLTTSNSVTLTSGTAITYGAAGSAAQVGSLNNDYQGVLEQIDKLLVDASYKGANLLRGANDSIVKFNEDGTSFVTIKGLNLGIDNNTDLKFTKNSDGYDFTTVGGITAAIDDTTAAITELRSISSTFGSNMGVIQTRESFTTELVNVLETGAGKLVNANLEEESANMLALQTRQALGIQALSISNQSNQSILSLFR
jgi:flagellin-like hook-associated protein FlgL